nr:hypothetical protein Iba_chr14aCG5570 [Ipomoea batatas]
MAREDEVPPCGPDVEISDTSSSGARESETRKAYGAAQVGKMNDLACSWSYSDTVYLITSLIFIEYENLKGPVGMLREQNIILRMPLARNPGSLDQNKARHGHEYGLTPLPLPVSKDKFQPSMEKDKRKSKNRRRCKGPRARFYSPIKLVDEGKPLCGTAKGKGNLERSQTSKSLREWKRKGMALSANEFKSDDSWWVTLGTPGIVCKEYKIFTTFINGGKMVQSLYIGKDLMVKC